MQRVLLQAGFALALTSACAYAQVRQEVEPTDPSPAELPAATGEALPGKSIRPVPATSNDPGTQMDRKQPQSSTDGKDGSQKSIIRSPLNTKDKAFVVAAGQIGKTEIEAGQFALTRSKNPAVVEFAQMMVTDHGKSYAKLQDIAARETIDISKLDAKHSQVLSELSAAPAADFDRSYVSKMVSGHKDAETTIATMAQDTDDAELKAYADETLATVRMHLTHASKLDAAMVAGASSRGAKK